jgi:hypothetical protein
MRQDWFKFSEAHADKARMGMHQACGAALTAGLAEGASGQADARILAPFSCFMAGQFGKLTFVSECCPQADREELRFTMPDQF